MPDYRTMFDHRWTKAWDLGDADRVVTILKVTAGIIEDPSRQKKDRLPILHLKGWPKPLGLNKTNANTVGSMYGNMTEAWVGKRITLYVTKTRDPRGGGEVDCIRIRPKPPEKPGEPAPNLAPPTGGEEGASAQ